MALCACTACTYTPGNLYTCMTCTPLISVDTMGINQDFRFEMKKICTHLRGGSDITEPRLRVHICLFVHYALNHLYFFHFSFLLPPLPSIIDVFLKKTRRWRKKQHYHIHLPLHLSMNLYGEGEVCGSVFPLFRGSPRV